MGRVKNINTLLVSVALFLMFAVVTAACGPESSEPASPAVSAPPAVDTPSPEATDTPEGLGQTEEGRLTSDEESSAGTVTPKAEAEATIKPQEGTTVIPPAGVEEAAPTSTPIPAPKTSVAPELIAAEVEGIVAWINSEPLKIHDLTAAGKVVLVDFWTYTCVNCIRTFPYLKLWHAKYADDGLVILGVHTPEFSFEEKLENVRQAVKDYSIGWPVALDNDYSTWRAYHNRYWPAKYLIDKDGVVRYKHFGEGAYGETELRIRELLEEAGADLSELDAGLPGNQSVDPTYLSDSSAQITRELYAGWERGYAAVRFGSGGYVGHQEYYDDRDTVISYTDPGQHLDHRIYLQGPWYNGKESLRHNRETSNFEDHMALRFSAKSVNVVIKPEGDGFEPFKVRVTLDGDYLTDANKGDEVVIEADGRSFIYVDEPRLYSVIQAPSYGTYELKLSSNSPHFAIFAFTFGVYESGI